LYSLEGGRYINNEYYMAHYYVTNVAQKSQFVVLLSSRHVFYVRCLKSEELKLEWVEWIGNITTINQSKFGITFQLGNASSLSLFDSTNVRLIYAEPKQIEFLYAQLLDLLKSMKICTRRPSSIRQSNRISVRNPKF